MRARGTRLLLGALALPLLIGATFTGTQVRDQDAVTMERGLSRVELSSLRSFRSLESLWILVAPSRAEWDEDVAPELAEALAKPPSQFRTWASFLPPTIGRAGPDVSGGLLHVELPDGRGKGVLAVWMPPLINDGRQGTALLNSPEPNRGRFLSGVEVGRAPEGAERVMRGLFLPSWPRALGRSGPPPVPLRPLPDDGAGALTIFAGEVGPEHAPALWDLAGSAELPLGPMDTFPRRLSGLSELLRSVRVTRPAVSFEEGAAATLAQAPGHWTVAERAVRHPTRYASLAAPVAVDLDGEEHAAVVGVVAFYTPLLMTADEAAAWLEVDGDAFARAVHAGELPFLRDGSGSDLWFLRGWLQRWKAGDATAVGKKPLTTEEAAELARSWGAKQKLRGLERASRGPLPHRMVALPAAEREGLVDERVAATARVDREDLAGWLRRFEPSLKQGKRQPAWTLAFTTDAAELPVTFSLERASGGAEAVAARSSSSGDRWGARGSSGGGGGGPATVGDDDGASGAVEASGAAVHDGAVQLAILDFYTSDGICRIGSSVQATLGFDVGGVPLGTAARLQAEWDLVQDGRWVGQESIRVEREAGSHEVEFDVPCPKEEGAAELSLSLLPAGEEDRLVDATMPLEVRPPGGRSWPALRMPEAKACRGTAASEGAADDDGFSMGGSAGLSADQIGSAVRGFQRQTLRCREGRAVSGTVQLELTVGCDGRVAAAEVLADGTGDSGFADCVARVMTYAPFPAHDLPDGAIFGLPLRFE